MEGLESMQPLVTVIIPTYNRAELLTRALNSVINQTYANLEIIVVDDASTDETQLIMSSMIDKRMIYIRHDVNQRGSAARNTGIRAATGEFIAFLDDDDEYMLDKIKILVEVLSKTDPEIGIAYSRVKMVRDGKIVGFHPKYDGPRSTDPGNIFLEFLGRPMFASTATLIKRHALVLYDEVLPRWQDVDFHLRILQKHKAVFVDIVTAIWNIDDNRHRISTNPHALEEAIRIIEGKFFGGGIKTFNRLVYAKFLRNVGFTSLATGDQNRIANKYLLRAFMLRPSMMGFVEVLIGVLGARTFMLLYKLKSRIKA